LPRDGQRLAFDIEPNLMSDAAIEQNAHDSPCRTPGGRVRQSIAERKSLLLCEPFPLTADPEAMFNHLDFFVIGED
jgi:hypothetical protein